MNGRITLFHARPEESKNPPALSGFVEFEDGTKANIKLWRNESVRATNGEYFSGVLKNE